MVFTGSFSVREPGCFFGKTPHDADIGYIFNKQ